MPCLFNHRWTFDFRLHYVYRKCQFCNVTERHIRNRESEYAAWEPVKVRRYVEPEQGPIVQARVPMFVRMAHSLGLMRTKTGEGTRSLARST